jgi:hypothetical protein
LQASARPENSAGLARGSGTALTEATANFLVNCRMAKPQQMRWSRRGADLLLQCAVLNGKLGCGLGQLFHADANSNSEITFAA